MNPPHFPSSMPGSFLPSIPPSIPAYPKGVPVRPFHRPPPLATARDRLHFDSPFSPPLLDEGPEASDDDEMRNSTYSDHAYRSALTAPTTNSRKRSLATDDYSDEDRSAPPRYEEDRPAKRRIIDVVGSVASRVWEFCKARVPLYSSTPGQPAMTRDPDEHMYHPDMPACLNGFQSPSYPPYEVGRVNAEQQNPQHQQYHEQQGRYMPSPTDFSAGGKHVVDGGLSSRWVMVSPAPTASTAPSSASSSSSRPAKRHVRPIIAASTRKRPVMRASHQRSRSSSTLASAPPQSSFTFSTGSPASSFTSASPASRASRRKPRVEEDETDESIRRFQERLRDMIREGREALGSTVEVLYDDEYPI